MVTSSESSAAFSDLVLIFWPFSDHLKQLVRILDKARIFWPIGSTVYGVTLGGNENIRETLGRNKNLDWRRHVQRHSSCLVKIYDTHDRRIVEYSVIQYNRIQYNRLYNSTIHRAAFILTSLKLNHSGILRQ